MNSKISKNVGDVVKFRLDGRREGEGKISEIYLDGKDFTVHSYSVELSFACKEFLAGVNIIVFPDELI